MATGTNTDSLGEIAAALLRSGDYLLGHIDYTAWYDEHGDPGRRVVAEAEGWLAAFQAHPTVLPDEAFRLGAYRPEHLDIISGWDTADGWHVAPEWWRAEDWDRSGPWCLVCGSVEKCECAA